MWYNFIGKTDKINKKNIGKTDKMWYNFIGKTERIWKYVL